MPRLRREVWQKLKGLEIASCRFANLPEKKRTQFSLTREEMKNCIWLKPTLVAQIEFTEWTPDGHLRHSKFVGLRDDKDPRGRLCGRTNVSISPVKHEQVIIRSRGCRRCNLLESWRVCLRGGANRDSASRPGRIDHGLQVSLACYTARLPAR